MQNQNFPGICLLPSLTSRSPRFLCLNHSLHHNLWTIGKETNEYAAQKGQQNFRLDVPDLKLFLAVLLVSGYVSLPRWQMYWESKNDVHNHQLISLAMSYNCFTSVHFANNNTLDCNDKFAKVRPLIDYVNSTCLGNFLPEQTLSIDESMRVRSATLGCILAASGHFTASD